MDFEEARTRLGSAFLFALPRRPLGLETFGVTDEEELDRQRTAEQLAGSLLKDAIARGIPHLELVPELVPLSGGAAADFVFRARASLSFIIKVQESAKLREEALWLKSLHPDVVNATPWGRMFPRIHSQQLTSSPYAYVMEDFRREDGYQDLASWIFEGELLPAARALQSRQLIAAVLEQLLPVYRQSRDFNSRTSLDGDAYLGRIEGRLKQAVEFFPGFSLPVRVNGESLQPWQTYVREIRAQRARVEALFPAFETAVHGDSHPGNIMLRLRGHPAQGLIPEIRLIDPKGWKQGDYVFDLAKLAHYLEVTGPLERWDLINTCSFEITQETLEVTGLPDTPVWLDELSQHIRASAAAFGPGMGDPQAQDRFALAMASALLGSASLRWENGEKTLAVAMYVRGLKWLEVFCEVL